MKKNIYINKIEKGKTKQNIDFLIGQYEKEIEQAEDLEKEEIFQSIVEDLKFLKEML